MYQRNISYSIKRQLRLRDIKSSGFSTAIKRQTTPTGLGCVSVLQNVEKSEQRVIKVYEQMNELIKYYRTVLIITIQKFIKNSEEEMK